MRARCKPETAVSTRLPWFLMVMTNVPINTAILNSFVCDNCLVMNIKHQIINHKTLIKYYHSLSSASSFGSVFPWRQWRLCNQVNNTNVKKVLQLFIERTKKRSSNTDYFLISSVWSWCDCWIVLFWEFQQEKQNDIWGADSWADNTHCRSDVLLVLKYFIYRHLHLIKPWQRMKN